MSVEPVTQVASEPSTRRPSRPTSLPRRWDLSPSAKESFVRRFGKDIDVDYSVLRFVAYYVEHPEKTSSDWTAKCAQWLAKDAADVRAKRPDPNGPDDMGMPRWLHARMDGKGNVREETPEEQAARARLAEIHAEMDRNRRQA